MFGKTEAQKAQEAADEKAMIERIRKQQQREDNQAFPSMRGQYNYWSGMTLREYYAGLAMQGFCSVDIAPSPTWAKELAEAAVEVADALLAALEAKKP